MNFASGTWSDALDKLGIRGVIDGLTLRSGAGPILGPALTVKETAGEFPLEDFRIADILDAITPGAVLVVDVGGAAVSTFGGLAALAALKKGVSGVIIDGACRDLAEIQDSGLWLASRHVTPASGKGRIKTDAIGVAANVGAITVNLGDFIAGDETGIVCIPGDRLEDVAQLTREFTARDENFRELLRAGDSFRAIAGRVKYL